MTVDGTDTNLYQTTSQTILHNARELAGVRERPIKVIVEIRMGIEMEYGYLGKAVLETSQNWIRDRMIAAEADERVAQGKCAAHYPLNFGVDRCNIGWQYEVASVVKGVGQVHTVLRPQIARAVVEGFANARRCQGRTSQIAGMGIKGNAQQGNGPCRLTDLAWIHYL